MSLVDLSTIQVGDVVRWFHPRYGFCSGLAVRVGVRTVRITDRYGYGDQDTVQARWLRPLVTGFDVSLSQVRDGQIEDPSLYHFDTLEARDEFVDNVWRSHPVITQPEQVADGFGVLVDYALS